MPRPATDTEERLIRAGREVLEEKGFSGLTLRLVASRARANLGHFSYYFDGKEDFTRRVAQGIYEEFFRDFSLEVEGQPDALEALRAGLLRLADMTREHRLFILSLFSDLRAGNPEARRFAFKNGPRHGRILFGLVKRCQSEGRLRKMPFPAVMAMLFGAVAGPNLLSVGLAAAAPRLPFNLARRHIEASLLDDAALAERVDLILKALKP